MITFFHDAHFQVLEYVKHNFNEFLDMHRHIHLYIYQTVVSLDKMIFQKIHLLPHIKFIFTLYEALN